MKDEDRTKGQLINELIELRQRIAELGKSKTGREQTQEAPRESEELYTHTDPLDTITSLKPGDHLCCLYETEEEHRSLLTPFLRQGLERGEKVLYIVDAHTADTVLEYLRDDGLEVAPYLASGQLGILTGNDVYLQRGVFDPDRMIALLRSETERALAEGHTALRITGEMTWALRGLLGSERLIEYESKLNAFFPGSKCLAICQYDRRRFDAQVLLDVLAIHPIVVIGSEVYDNFYYTPPGDLLGPDRPAATLRSWLESLAERKRAEEALKESEERYRSLYESSKDGIAISDMQGNILDANQAFLCMVGYTIEEIKKLSYQQLMPKKWYEMVAYVVKNQIMARGYSDEYEIEYIKKDGTVFPITIRGWLIKDKQGNPTGMWAIIRDTTERKREQEERDRLLAGLEAKNRELESFVYAVSHDLKAPLISLDGFSSTLQREFHDQLGDEGKHYLERIQANAAHMDALIMHLLELSLIGKVVGPIEEIDLTALLREIQEELAVKLEKAGAEFVVHEPLPSFRADRSRIGQVFTNLIANAVKFSSEDRPLRIEVGCQEEGDFYRFHVADNSIGIAPQYQEQIFAPFRQLDSEAEGVGIGLALVKKIVEDHGGRVWVDSEEGEGATFYFTLRRARPEVEGLTSAELTKEES